MMGGGSEHRQTLFTDYFFSLEIPRIAFSRIPICIKHCLAVVSFIAGIC